MKTLATIIEGIVLLLALAIICVRCSEVSGSDSGLWAEYPHSGFCPDSPQWHEM